MWSYRAWKRLPGARLAAAHSCRCSCRTLSRGASPPGSLAPVLPGIPSCLPAPSARSPQGPFPPAALFVTAFVPVLNRTVCGTSIPSDSRCTALDFAVGLYEPPRPDTGGADGSLVFRTSPDTRAAPRTPPEPSTGFGTLVLDVAFTVT